MPGSEIQKVSEYVVKKHELTLIAMVRRVAMTSSELPKTWLSGRAGSYSHIADVVSTAAILVIWPITTTFARLTMCAKHLRHNN